LISVKKILSGAVVVMKLILIVIIVAIVPPMVQKYHGWHPTMPPIQKRVDVVGNTTPSWTKVAMIAARKKVEAALMARKKFEVCDFLIWKFCKKVAQPNKYFFAAIFFRN
jgi:hypothetical protein